MTHTLLIEKSTNYPDSVRAVIIEEDENGARMVLDIVETHREGAEYLFEAVADGYPGWKFEGWQVQETDMGRARTNRTMIRKIVEQLP